MTIKTLLLITLISITAALYAGASADIGKNKVKQCSAPRPEVCLAVCHPVCATRDTGVRCVTTPCPSSEQITYSNDCFACADKRVFSYHKGACSG